MKIQKITKQNNGKYKLKLDDNSTIITYDNVILNNNLLFDNKLSNEKLENIEKENSYYDIYNLAVKYCMKKMCSKKEIVDFLKEKDASDIQIKKIMDSFEEKGIINDIMYVRAYIHDRSEFSNDGPFKIRENLLKMGIENSIIEDEMSKIDNSFFDKKLSKLVMKKINSNQKYSNSILKRKISSELYILGYDTSNIDEYFKCDDKEILKKECIKLNKKYSLKYSGEELISLVFKKLYSKGFNKENIMQVITELI